MRFFRFFGFAASAAILLGLQNIEWYAYALFLLGWMCASLVWLNPEEVKK